MTKMLLEKGINVLIVTQSKQSALHSAVEANKPPVIQAILEFLASDEEKKKQLFLIKNADDKTAWEVAVAARNKTLCQLLKDSGDPNAEGSAACVIC